MTPLPYWCYPEPIEPMRTPYPWRRVWFALVFTALCLLGSVIAVVW